MEKNKKSNKVLIIVIIILSILLLGTISYIVIDKTNLLSGKKEVKNNTTIEKAVTKDLSEDDVDELLTIIQNVYNANFAEDYPLENMDNIPNQKFLEIAYRNIGQTVLTKESLTKAHNKYFYGIELTHEDILCSVDNIPLYKYDSTTENYSVSENHPGHGGGGLANNRVFFQSAKQKGDTITIKVKVVYERYCGDVCGPLNSYYKNFKDAINLTSPVLGDPSSETEIELDNKEFDNIKDKIPVSTYVIEKIDDNYSLKSVTIE